jgi:hypothetical protein
MFSTADQKCTLVHVLTNIQQNLAMAMTYAKTGRFRMCPTAFQVGPPEFQTVDGHEIPNDQVKQFLIVIINASSDNWRALNFGLKVCF